MFLLKCKMDNIYLNILFISILFLSILFIIISILAIYYYYNSKQTILPPSESICIVSNDLLINISDYYCCFVGNTITSSKYIPSLNMVVNPVSIPYLNVCIEYCGISGIDESKTLCNNIIYQEDFEKCIEISKPINCVGLSMPVAVSGINYYYPNAAGQSSCQIQKEC